MWLVFDIGNSSIKGGLFDGDRLEHTFVLSHDALAAGLDAEMDAHAGGSAAAGRGNDGDAEREAVGPAGRTDIDRAGLVSVVPESAERLARLLRARDLDVAVVHHAMRLPFKLAYRTPETLGTDRLAAAAAAWTLFGKADGRSVVALDAGTALTYEVVDGDGTYRGGTIAPGPVLMQQALSRKTAQLPDVALELPDEPVGRSTTEAIQAGVMYGFIEGVRGLLRRIDESLGEEAFVVATGGWRGLLHRQLEEIDAVDAHLVLRGVRILMLMNP